MQTSETLGNVAYRTFCAAGEMWLTLPTVAIQGQVLVECHPVSLFSGEKEPLP